MRKLRWQPGLGPLSMGSVIFLLFFLSGFCGLCYQIVWLRKAFAAFGIITPVLSVVLSVFMLGLAIGSYAGGHWAEAWVARTKRSPILLYAAAELLIGSGALLVPLLFASGETLLLSAGESDSAGYLLRSALIIGASILPWCIAMGTTFPFMLAFLRSLDGGSPTGFSMLYLANTIGAMVGALATALVLIELLGFTATLQLAASFNLLIALISTLLARHASGEAALRAGTSGDEASRQEPILQAPSAPASPLGIDREPIILPILFLTGLISMGMEVAWTRAFIPVLETTIYAFASILTVYLLATWVGSALYRRHLARGVALGTAWLVLIGALGALLPLLLNDPRLAPGPILALASIFPFCGALGYLTPLLVDMHSAGDPTRAGRAYAANVFGSLLGPLLTGYVLLPRLGVKNSLIVLALPLLVLALQMPLARRTLMRPATLAGLGSLALGLVVSMAFTETHEERFARGGTVRRDHTATVVSTADTLLVNGVGITHRTTVTKLMAHLPLATLEQPPERALVICFGMGTTFRSLATWGLDVTAVELVPSVKQAFGDFFPDAQDVLASARTQVIVDDGRRFLKRTNQKYDVITLDPPPPVEASGSGLLYSKEFYESAKQRLSDHGVLQQWFPGGTESTTRAVTQTIADSFPYVRAFASLEGWGVHFLASRHPITLPTPREFAERLPPAARADLAEWSDLAPQAMMRTMTRNEFVIRNILRDNQGYYISDDRPMNEYYLMRRTWGRLWD